MTAEEIRAAYAEVRGYTAELAQDRDKAGNEAASLTYQSSYSFFLSEIAAQLAELNATLKANIPFRVDVLK